MGSVAEGVTESAERVVSVVTEFVPAEGVSSELREEVVKLEIEDEIVADDPVDREKHRLEEGPSDVER